MIPAPRPLDIPLGDGTLRINRWGDGPSAALAVHGITGSSVSWLAVARALPADWTLYAPDLRGRGHSAGLPGPYGLQRHVEDLHAAVRHLELDRPVLVGHSLGAFVALLAKVTYPEVFGDLLLVDGGLPLPVPDGADLDALLALTLGPALARLRETYPSVPAYLDFWRAHPAFVDNWNTDVDAYVRYDADGDPDAVRSRVSEDAARADGRDLLAGTEVVGAALAALPAPTLLLRAPAGMFGQPPGLLADELVQRWQPRAPRLSVETVPGTNHYTILFDPLAAAEVARRITGAAR